VAEVGFQDPADGGAVVLGRLALLGVYEYSVEVGFEGDELGDLGEHPADVAAGGVAAVVDGEDLGDLAQGQAGGLGAADQARPVDELRGSGEVRVTGDRHLTEDEVAAAIDEADYELVSG
jgi:hypothetical protein